MANTPLDAVMQHIRSLVGAQSDQTDGALLHAFSACADQAAFAALMKRHGPLVLAVCRRVLHQLQDAEDAFQATFIVLARRAASFSKKGSLGGWLHRVAYRIALDARRAGARRRKHERQSHTVSPINPAFQAAWREVQLVLDEEIQRLPEKYREPFILCCLENQSCAAAARRLGIKEATIWSRLTEARKRLQKRLSRRGVELTAVLATAALAPDPIMAGALMTKVVSAATLPTGIVSERVAFLVHGMTRCLMLQKAKMGVVLFLAVSAMVGVTGVGAFQLSGAGQLASQEKNPRVVAVVKEEAERSGKKASPTDLYGDPLPPQALARLGTTRLRHASIVSGVIFSRDGKTLISGGWDNVIRFWDSATGKQVREIKKPATGGGWESIYAIALSPDGKSVTAGGWGSLGLWDTTSGKQLWLANIGQVFSLAFSPNGKMLAVGHDAGVTVLEAATGAFAREQIRIPVRVNCVGFSPDGKTLASGCQDKTLRLWNLGTGKEVRRFLGHQGEVKALAFSPDGKILASGGGGADKTLCLWDVTTGTKLHQREPGRYWVEAIAFSGDGKTLASAGHDKSIFLWEVATGKEMRRLQSRAGGIMSIAFSPDDTKLAAGGSYFSVEILDASTGKDLLPLGGHHGGIDTLTFASDGRTLATAGRDRAVRLWNVTTARELRRFEGHKSEIGSIAISPDGKTLASSDKTVTIRVWDLAKGKEIRQFPIQLNDGFCIAYSPDGKTIAATKADASIVLMDAVTGTQLRSLVGHTQNPIYTIAFSPDGKTLASGSLDTTVRLWDVATGKEIRQITGNEGWIFGVAFSPDGKTLASAAGGGPGQEKDVRLWDVLTGKQLRQFKGHEGPVFNVGFSPDGRTLVASSRGSVRLWEVETGQPRAHFQGQEFAISAVGFSPDGKILASGSQDSTVILWDVTGLEKVAQSGLTRAGLDSRWAELAGEDGTKAFRAIWLLAATPEKAVPFFKDRLRSPAPAEQAAKLISDLDSEQFVVRVKAAKGLDDLGEAAEGAVRKTLNGNPSLETRQRLEMHLAKRERDVIRKLRAIESLEHMGTSTASQLLQVLTQESPNPRVVQWASTALDRVAKRMARNP